MRDYPRRILALLIVMVMVIGLFPTTINAASGHEENATDEVRAFTADDKAAERPESQVPGTQQRDGETPAVVTFISSGTLIDTVNTFVDETLTLPATAPEIEDWSFVGWMTETLDRTDVKPSYYKPGASYTVDAAELSFYALYTQVEGGDGVCYRLVTETPDDWTGKYVLSSSTDAAMHVMSGVSGNVNIESENKGHTAFADTGMTLEGDALRNVADTYLFSVADRGSSSYSFQNVAAESYLAIYSSYLYTRANYEMNYCRWIPNVAEAGVSLKCTASTGYPYISFGSKFEASSGVKYIQLWKEAPDGTVYYWTDPNVGEHTHVMTAYPAVAPTCGEAGNIAYWRCTVCYKYFSDEAGENQISLAETVLPATGEHSFGTCTSNNDGTHTHSCSVCGLEETVDCSFDDGVVTPPTTTEQGYTTYTCTACGYSYKDNYVQSLGVDYTVSFSVPDGIEKPDDMISNTNTGITLPTITAPEGFKFVGWVENTCDNVTVCPETILNGHYVASDNVTLYALFKYMVDDGSGTEDPAFTLVTETPDDWSGNYVITYLKTSSLNAMKGLAGGASYENANSGGAAAYSITGMTLEDNVLSNVTENYIFTIAAEDSGNYSIQSVSQGSYVAINSSTLMALANYASASCDWTLTLKEGGSVALKLASGGSYPYVAFGSSKFWCHSNTANIYLWRQAESGTPYWTTELPSDPVTVYFVDQDNNETAYVYATGTAAENAPFPGVALNALGVDENGNKYYKISLDRGDYSSVTFSGGTDETKTEALSLAGDENLVYYVSNHTATAGADVWPAPAVEIPATCTEAGSVTYTGLLTGETHVTVIPALGHTLVSHAAVAPTCGANGNIAYWQCSVCNKYFSDEAAENEITEAETVDPATGAHTFGEFTANNDKTHTRTCSVCGAAETENCAFDDGVVTAPTATEQGYTTYTCAVCGYSYKDNYVQSLGVDYTVSFSVPEGVEQPESMISNTNTGITLPTVTGPEGYQFAGWVETACDNATVRPEAILNGQYIAQSNVTLYALFKHVVDDGTTVGNSDSFELVTEAPDNWSGNYVITYKNNTTSLAAMKGIDGGKSYETASNGGASAYSITGMILEDNVLSNVSENYIYTVSTEESGNYSIKSVSKESYVAIQSNTLMSLSGYAEATCDWTLGLKEDGTAMIKLAAGGSYPYVAFGSSRFWCHSATADIYLWRQATGTTYWTTVIAQEDLVNLYFVDQDNNETAYVYASGTETENAAFPGAALTALGTDENGYNYYMITLDRNIYSSVTFSGGTDETKTEALSLGTGENVVYYVSNHAATTGTDVWPAPGVELSATCTEAGSVTYTGLLTGETHVKEIPALGHDWSDWSETTAPTCTTAGEKTRNCSRCEAVQTEVVEALGHDVVNHDAKEPTCTEIGWNAYETCTRCNYTTYEEIPALGHDVVNHDAKEPTCTEIGWDTYETCARCDYTTYVEKPALGHDIVNHDAKAPTCTEIGWDAYETCARCDYTTYAEIPALGHDVVNHDAKAPTCTESGWDAYETCSRCDYTTYVEKPALGHDVVNHDAKAPTCTEIGWDAYETCARCDYTTYAEKAALGHDYNAVVTEPTCTEKGFTTHTCSRCGDSYTDNETEALGHEWNEGVVTVEPKYQTPGEKTFTCTRCGETKTEEIARLANPFEDVHDEDFFFNPVLWALDESVTGGIDETHFAPAQTVMRADAMVFFWAANKRPAFTSTDKTFKDVKKKHWAYNAVMWAVENGITGGTDAAGNYFSPQRTCTRSEVLQFLYAAMGKPEYSIENPYSDVKTKHWYYDGAIWAYEKGLEKGENGKFKAKTPCTRGYVVTYLYRYMTGNELAE